jgi:multidrug efflux pump subunit AcrA (membrane-fusion protein)
MASEYDATEFVDTEFQARKSPYATSPSGPGLSARAPSREEVDMKVTEAQQKLADLKRAQEELERERAALEEVRRRQAELQTGRQEMIHQLTRGLGLLEEAEFTARRDAEQMAKALADLRDALSKVEAVREESWNKENFNVELTRALTAIENARMEWNGARLKFPILTGETTEGGATPKAGEAAAAPFATLSFAKLCRLGLALTWPLALLGLAALGLLAAVLLNR